MQQKSIDEEAQSSKTYVKIEVVSILFCHPVGEYQNLELQLGKLQKLQYQSLA